MRTNIHLTLCFFIVASSLQANGQETVDVAVYGATSSGIAAAVSAAKSGQSVALLEPTGRIGGLVTSGLSHTDFHSFESLTGTFLDFSRRVEGYYAETYGKDSPQVRDSFRGTFGEPKVNLAIFERMLAEFPRLTVRTGYQLEGLEVNQSEGGTRITSARFAAAEKEPLIVSARVFIDGTYEGDLMARAGVPFRVGREGRDEYGESLAPEQPDVQLQAYNFRFIMTPDPANRVTPIAPAGYLRDDFVDVLPILKSGKILKVFDYPKNCIFKAQTPPLPNGKYDINDVSRGVIRLSLPGKNLAWPEGTVEQRAEVFAEHLRDQVGLLYFLQNDEAVPERFRKEAQQWGWCRDEFTETGHLPPQLYVREARRMVGKHVFKQGDSEYSPGDARAVLHSDSIAMGDYGNNCHGTHHEGPRFGGTHTGELYNPVPPYQIPYGVLIPQKLENLIVPVAASSTHVGFCALRLEPIWMSLGQAAGHAAALANETNVPVQEVCVPALQERLHADGSATNYVSDVLPGDEDFTAVQWWGTLGGLHGLAPTPKKWGQRGKKLHGQYCEATPDHAAQLSLPLDVDLRQRWIQLAVERGLTPPTASESKKHRTRGDFIRWTYLRTHGKND